MDALSITIHPNRTVNGGMTRSIGIVSATPIPENDYVRQDGVSSSSGSTRMLEGRRTVWRRRCERPPLEASEDL
jgi:hypothetical protein